jgi:hypothetical protein
MYFEGTSEEHVRSELARLQVAAHANITKGTIWPRPDVYHLPLTVDVVEALAAYLAAHPVGHFCSHCHVYREQELLLQWYDAFSDPIYLADSIEPAQALAFAKAFGSSCKRYAG